MEKNGLSTRVFPKMWIKFSRLFENQEKNTKKPQKKSKKPVFLWITTPKFAQHPQSKSRKMRWITPKKGEKAGKKQAKTLSFPQTYVRVWKVIHME